MIQVISGITEDCRRLRGSEIMQAKWITRPLLEKVMREARKRGAAVFTIDAFMKGGKFKSLIFTVLSARTKDETTLAACRKLFSKIKTPEDLAGMGEKEVEGLIYGAGFYRTKAKRIIALSKKLISDFQGKVPADFNSLLSLPGVGRKTANVVLAHAFGKDAIGVDVHVHRISNRLGIVRAKNPGETEKRLVEIIPKSLHRILNIAFVSHGQTTCIAKIPFCSRCAMRKYCKRAGVGRYR